LINEGITKNPLKVFGHWKAAPCLKKGRILVRKGTGPSLKKVRIYGLNSQNYGLIPIPSKPTRTILLPIYSALSGKLGFLYIEIIDC
jgi:hypothetical protein